MCCNELNTLVPFCQPDTDKATTLKWTATYLKYIKEVYGDSPREVDCISIYNALKWTTIQIPS